MFLDRTGWHQAKALVVPDNLTLDWLPAYSPQCNPQELVWREVRREPFGNHDYDSLTYVENALERRLCQLESAPAKIQSLAGFDWIVNVRLNCIKCENEARAVCQFCGRAVCKDHIQAQRFVSSFASFGGILSVNDNALSVDDAVWCGVCTPQYHRSK